MKTSDEKIAEAFGLNPVFSMEVPENVEVKSHPENKQQDMDEDYALVRENLHNLLIKSNHALTNLMQLAEEQPNARVHEVTAGMIKTIADTSHSLLDINKNTQAPQTQTVNNTLNITSAEMLKLLKDSNE
jgi:hypothetical protein